MNTPDFFNFAPSFSIDKIISSLSIRERIAKSIFVAAFSYPDSAHEEKILSLIDNKAIGGLTFFQGSAKEQLRLTQKYQQLSKDSLLLFIDAEWGISMRLKEISAFPYAMTLAATKDVNLTYSVASLIAKQCQTLGVHSPLAPVVDINNNVDNPVIGLRSFGDNIENVVAHSEAFSKGLRDSNVLDCVKHFPGHGNTNVDSHLDLPSLNFSLEELENTELKPFRALIKEGASAVMTAHMHVPSLDDTDGIPVSLSEKGISYLKERMGFRGLTVTDAMDMQAIAKHYGEVESGVLAYKAGNDVILNCTHPLETINAIEKAYEKGEINEAFINQKCEKLIKVKSWATSPSLDSSNLEKSLEELDQATKILNRKIYEKALTLISSQGFKDLNPHDEKLAVLHVFCDKRSLTDREKKVEHHLKHESLSGKSSKLIKKIELETSWKQYEWSSDYEQSLESIIASNHGGSWIVFVHGVNFRPMNNYDIPFACLSALSGLFSEKEVILCFPANPYALSIFENLNKVENILLTYQEDEQSKDVLLDALLGRIIPEGKLPVELNL